MLRNNTTEIYYKDEKKLQTNQNAVEDVGQGHGPEQGPQYTPKEPQSRPISSAAAGLMEGIKHLGALWWRRREHRTISSGVI